MSVICPMENLPMPGDTVLRVAYSLDKGSFVPTKEGPLTPSERQKFFQENPLTLEGATFTFTSGKTSYSHTYGDIPSEVYEQGQLVVARQELREENGSLVRSHLFMSLVLGSLDGFEFVRTVYQ